MTATSVAKRIIQILYRLTVGLAVELIKAALLHICVLCTVTALSAAVAVVTWQTYAHTSSLGYTAIAAVSALLVCCVLVVVVHRLARDVFGLTTLSLREMLALMFGRRSGVSKGDKHLSKSTGADDVIILRKRVVQRTTIIVKEKPVQ